MLCCKNKIRPGSAALLLALVSVSPLAAEDEPFPQVSPATRAQAIGVLTGGGASLPVPCLTPLLHAEASRTAPAARSAAEFLRRPETLAAERRFIADDGTLVRYSMSSRTFDRLSPTAELPAAAAAGVAEARAFLVGSLGLADPGPVELLLARIGSDVRGYMVRAESGQRLRLVLEGTAPTRTEDVRSAAIHQFAHAVADQMPGAWAESLASWTEMRLTGGPDPATAERLTARISRLDEGLLTSDLALASANALWFAFLEEAYGVHAVRLAIEELSSGTDERSALDRAVRRAAGEDLRSALRSLQLWSLLVGERSDGRHFSFAERLTAPRFAARADGLPALSVSGDAPVASLGGSSVLLVPDEHEGGMRVAFEGEFAADWEVDLLLLGRDGAIHRRRLEVTNGRGEATVPLTGVIEVAMLVRNLGGDDGEAHAYTWTADHVRAYPFDLESLEARWSSVGTPGVAVIWETASERGLLGFNVLRTDLRTDEQAKINPVWIPAVGSETLATSYQFLDRGADPEGAYRYVIEGVTIDGLTSRSAAVDVAGPIDAL